MSPDPMITLSGGSKKGVLPSGGRSFCFHKTKTKVDRNLRGRYQEDVHLCLSGEVRRRRVLSYFLEML